MSATQQDPRQGNIDLMNRYAHALDVRDWALFESLFTAGASFAMREWGENAVPLLVYEAVPECRVLTSASTSSSRDRSVYWGDV